MNPIDELSLRFQGHIPAKKNSLRRIMRGNRLLSVPSKQYEAWHKRALFEVAHQVRPLQPPYAITAQYYPGDLRAFDLSNSQESIHDLLVELKILTDDNIFELQSFTCELGGLSKGEPYCDVIVYSLEQTEAWRSLKLLRDKEAMRGHVATLKEQGQKATQIGEKRRIWSELRFLEAIA